MHTHNNSAGKTIQNVIILFSFCTQSLHCYLLCCLPLAAFFALRLRLQVIMTDLPEALPILEHNTEATFGPPRDDDNHGRASDKTEESYPRGTPLLADGKATRPAIRQLCWGDSADAGQVANIAAESKAEAAAAAATTTASVGGEGPEWQGFDMIVVREGRMRHIVNCVVLFVESCLGKTGTFTLTIFAASFSFSFFLFKYRTVVYAEKCCSIRLQGNGTKESNAVVCVMGRRRWALDSSHFSVTFSHSYRTPLVAPHRPPLRVLPRAMTTDQIKNRVPT